MLLDLNKTTTKLDFFCEIYIHTFVKKYFVAHMAPMSIAAIGDGYSTMFAGGETNHGLGVVPKNK